MGNSLTLPKGFEERIHPERRKENKLIEFKDRRVREWRRAADNYERNGLPVKAWICRQIAKDIEREPKQ